MPPQLVLVVAVLAIAIHIHSSIFNFNQSTHVEHLPQPFISTTMGRHRSGHVHSFKNEGDGGVYINARRSRRRWMQYRSGRSNRLSASHALEVKVGHSKNLPRRVKDYRRCESDTQEIVWYGYFHAEKRMDVERRVHLALERRGIHRVRGVCAGSRCKSDHKEYFPFRVIKSFSRLKAIIREEMGLAGETDMKFYKINDWPPT
ncbi:hypothetical protein C8R43DRAFT_949949 [Mycena crocata]|nr:hypothetical protein C8R43DRAFT_949949 [Mycena crocata]